MLQRIFLAVLLMAFFSQLSNAQPATATGPQSGQNSSLPPPPPPPPVPLSDEFAADFYSPAKHCSGGSVPVVTWQQVRDFRERHSQHPEIENANKDFKPGAKRHDTDPSLISMPPVAYPESAIRKRITGTVNVLIFVSPEGDVMDSMVICSSGEDFSIVALRSVKAAKFSPGTVNGHAISSIAVIPVAFGP